jgi:hypothetical protein
MQENAYYKPGGETYHSAQTDEGVHGLQPSTGFAANAASFGGVDWTNSGMGSAAFEQNPQQDAADNTALGRIFIPA